MSAFTMSGNDVDVDATPEDNQERDVTLGPAALSQPSGDYQESDVTLRHAPLSQPSGENPENDEKLLEKMKLLSMSSKCNHSSGPKDDFYYDDFTRFNALFPLNLRKKVNIAIHHTDEDEDEAKELKSFIENNVQLTILDKCFRPGVELLKNISSDMKQDPLDVALTKADFLFVYVTKNFTESSWSNYQSISGVKAIVDRDKPCSLICVHSDQSSGYILPANLQNAPRLDFYQEKPDKFIKNIIEFFYRIIDKLLFDKYELTKNRELYYKQHSHKWPVNPESSSTETGKFSQHGSKGKQAAPANEANDVTLDSGAVGCSGSIKPVNPQPHYPKDMKVSQETSRHY